MKLITTLLFVLISFTIKAQTLTFDETVAYINQKFVCCSKSTTSYKDKSIEVTRNGVMTITAFVKDENRIFTPKINLLALYVGKDGKDPIYTTNNVLTFTDSAVHSYSFTFTSAEEADRVKKAFIYLQSLCKKNKEPFDN